MPEFKLPDVGEGLTEAEIVTWKVKVGDVIKVNDIVVEIETAKSLVELPSPYAGTVQALHVPEGETVPVGTPIISIGDAAAAPAPAPSAPAPSTESDPYLGLAEKAGAAGRGERDRHVQPGRDRRWREPDAGRLRPARGLGAAPPASRWREPEDRCRRRRAAAGAGRVRPGQGGGRRRRGGRGAAGARDSGRPPRGTGRRRPRAGQAPGPQARQGPRRRPPHADPVGAAGHRDPRGRARRDRPFPGGRACRDR